ncbi:septin [Podospora australis]|uniref:Septin n=1 Tax=Podospora australis TaxID=1536484 RepID=A0AAN6WT64_9PEZI|nr:septin [Podospora australis]
MKTQSILTAFGSILLLAVQSASAGCYSSGDVWPNTESARQFVQDACFNNGGMFTGNYAAGQTKSMCPKSGGKGLLFQVQNMGGGTADLDNQECYNRLTNEIFGCGRGGETVFGGWRYRADPGNC